MFVLAIDTSSPAVTAGVVLVAEGADGADAGITVLAERAPLAARGHGELLAPALAECLGAAGLAPADLGAVVAGVGPGPYTGLRVGLVTAAAFADALGVPAYGVCSLDAIAAQAQDESRPAGDLVVLTDARRKEVYWARYDGRERTAGPDVARPANVPLAGVAAGAGAAADLYADAWPALHRVPHRYPTPAVLVGLARDRIVAGAPGEILEPLYLRRPDAVVPGTPKAVTPR
ncbi:tRNA threonylcarbamoyl adenosine modification protein YeaZ [Jatrophihabitans endophyticus]|uniref:tRNA threonylcarbamoyl adenosine modification protein YeaZ n=1 Tax=Jatrophihabitans endophyticus TaxID=1206085 RepID=A0A1M5GGQ1_9ACTN|nr:tRNA (adenosine(37)-N6)-threonylcarbamoyltransferase complex dimerization subunit type 1 TsaB [Jatrophihabitans endophyticus]SHG02897.1 tRNA threonylcarbamoyl adenosine modification protein YeaZ [Jatrophihabitans endophyticus]